MPPVGPLFTMLRNEAPEGEGPAAGLGEAIGKAGEQVPKPADGFAAHVTIAYGNAAGPTALVAVASRSCSEFGSCGRA
ncbi:hypothetical protein GCM10027187_63490 [Streptosporangium sandarakinum]